MTNLSQLCHKLIISISQNTMASFANINRMRLDMFLYHEQSPVHFIVVANMTF